MACAENPRKLWKGFYCWKVFSQFSSMKLMNYKKAQTERDPSTVFVFMK